MFPTDLLIFSPASSTTMPLCAQRLANTLPSATAWARSFSWWGKTRSRPPRWRSKPSPSRSSDMTTHSVCQPGRPSPQGEGHAGSPALAYFQRTKSSGERLAASAPASTLAPALQHVQVLAGEQAVTGERLGREIDPVAPLVGVTLGKQVADQADHVVHVSGGVRDGVGALHAEGVHDLPPQGLVASSNLFGRTLLFDGAGDDLVLDVGHVRHEVDLQPAPGQVAAERVPDDRETAVAEVRRPRDRRPAQVDGEAARRTWLQGCHLPRCCVQESEHSKYGSGIMSDKMSTGGAGDKTGRRGAPEQARARGARGALGRAMGGRWHLPLRPDGAAANGSTPSTRPLPP